MAHDSRHFTEQLGYRIEAAVDAASEWTVVRLVKEDVVGRAAAAGAVCAAWLSLTLLDPVPAVLFVVAAALTWARLRRLPPPPEPDPDDWV